MLHSLRTCVISIVGLIASASALSNVQQGWEFGLGGTSYQLSRLTTSPDGKRQMQGTTFYHLHLQYHFPLEGMTLSPWLRGLPEGITAVTSNSGSSKTSLMSLGIPLVKTVANSWDLATGPVLLRYRIHGTGGLESLQNGESTAVFFKPGDDVAAMVWAWQLGGSFRYDAFRLALDLLLQGPLQSDKRSFSLMLTSSWATF